LLRQDLHSVYSQGLTGKVYTVRGITMKQILFYFVLFASLFAVHYWWGK